jgi:glyoxylase-like metal-dependent hydrolase (beta-lactamase superfamily II)
MIRDLSELHWRGQDELSSPTGNSIITVHHTHPLFSTLEEFEPGLAFVFSMANILVVSTSEGLVMVDSGSLLLSGQVHDAVRKWRPAAPLHTLIFTHGHVDHVFGAELYENEQKSKARVIAHENLPKRFHRYDLTQGYNGHINMRQFQLAQPMFPPKTSFRWPDETYSTRKHLIVGGVDFHLMHARGETDDATWVYIPQYKAIAAGDLFIWAAPNCGNPQKVQRFAAEWASALRAMQQLNAIYLFPGHGVPIVGPNRVHQALDETARYLESLVQQTLAAMNAGLSLDSVVAQVVPDPVLLARPYLRPSYDEPEFVVRNLWRLYGGWYDGNPAHLKPAPASALGREMAALSGGWKVLMQRATVLSQPYLDLSDSAHPSERQRLAGHLMEWATQALGAALSTQLATAVGPAAENINTIRKAADASDIIEAHRLMVRYLDKPGLDDLAFLHRARAEFYTRRADLETSLMSKGIFVAAARASEKVLKEISRLCDNMGNKVVTGRQTPGEPGLAKL